MEFKLRDRVVMTRSYDSHMAKSPGVIVGIDGSSALVAFDVKEDWMHNGSGVLPSRKRHFNHWWCPFRVLRLADPQLVLPFMK